MWNGGGAEGFECDAETFDLASLCLQLKDCGIVFLLPVVGRFSIARGGGIKVFLRSFDDQRFVAVEERAFARQQEGIGESESV